jgi:hypothetical protein
MQTVAKMSQEAQNTLQVLVGTETSVCRRAFARLVESNMQKAENVCKAQYDKCSADQQCRTQVRYAWRHTLWTGSKQMFESKICDKASWQFMVGLPRRNSRTRFPIVNVLHSLRAVSRQEFYECAQSKLNFGTWRRSSCVLPNVWPPPSCANTLRDIEYQCQEPTGNPARAERGVGWVVCIAACCCGS